MIIDYGREEAKRILVSVGVLLLFITILLGYCKANTLLVVDSWWEGQDNHTGRSAKIDLFIHFCVSFPTFLESVIQHLVLRYGPCLALL